MINNLDMLNEEIMKTELFYYSEISDIERTCARMISRKDINCRLEFIFLFHCCETIG